MFSDIDASIKELLTKAGGIGHADGLSEVDISFDIPNREWSNGLNNRATVNCYLFDIHERRSLREEGWELQSRGTRESARRQPPLFFDLTYLVTAWTSEIKDQHILLWQVLTTLMDNPVLGRPYLKGDLEQHEWPIHTTVAQLEGVLKSPGEFWTALENQIKPSLSYVVTIGRNRKAIPTGAPPVLSTGLRFSLPESNVETGFNLVELFGLPPGTKTSGVMVEATDANVQAATDQQGRVQFTKLPPGRHTLRATIDGKTHRRTVVLRGSATEEIDRRYHDVVRDQDDKGIGGVVVEVEGLDLRAVTDAQGRFALAVPPGSYTLRIQMDGYFQRRQITHRNQGYRMQLAFGGAQSDT